MSYAIHTRIRKGNPYVYETYVRQQKEAYDMASYTVGDGREQNSFIPGQPTVVQRTAYSAFYLSRFLDS